MSDRLIDYPFFQEAYFDTRSVNGCFTEIHGDPPRILGRFAELKRAHELWRPGDSIFLEN